MVSIAIANQKGGVGKTTTAINLSDALTQAGYKVITIDLDPQHNTSNTFGAEINNNKTVSEVILSKCDVKEAIQKTQMGDVIASNESLSETGDLLTFKAGRDFFIKKHIIEPLKKEYEIAIMDTPPNVGFFLMNALTAADGCIIPVRPEQYSMDGLSYLIKNIEDMKQSNPELEIYGILLSTFNAKNAIDRNIMESLPELAEQLGIHVFDTVIRSSQWVKYAQGISDTLDDDGNIIKADRSLYNNYPNSNAAKDYIAVAKELLSMIGGKL